ncbi:glycine cleavage T C-terminal barrel domain-containing protein [Streptomyces sp. NPDC045251]|uniref:glycine cleavage T C-terminal barrel domain-containing protein n=1 Tax=unclassified Streptomyces TaxID=2593676 RepID=UPI003402E948
MSPRRLPLHDEHVGLGARMTEAGGWTLPLEYAGAFQEYRAHRRGAVVWDASDLGSVRVEGPGAFALVQRTFTNDLRRAGPGRSQYTFLLSASDGGVVDDLIVWWVRDELLLLTPSRPDAVLDALRSVRATGVGTDCAVSDVSPGRVLLAVQGEEARARMAGLDREAVRLGPFRVRETRIEGANGYVATTRFGGQTGFELHLPAAAARAVHRRLVGEGVAPAGLAMRETHRVEAGVPRHGHELGPGITPLDAGCGAAVALDTDFTGRDALLAAHRGGGRRILRSVLMGGRRPPSPGDAVLLSGEQMGTVTSGNYSPRHHRGLGLGFVRPDVPVGTGVTVRTRHGDLDGEVTTVPVARGVVR